MKKLMLLAAGLLIASGAMAQENVLKEAERGLKVEVPDHDRIASMLEGAMTDPSTAENVKTWYLAGKNAFQTWQTGYEQLQVGANPDKVKMSNAIVKGFDYWLKALPMDTVVDAKGKVKTKYSKEIAKTLGNSPANFYDAGVFLYEAQDLPGAYRAWEIFTILPTLKDQLGAATPEMPVDSVMAATYYNMGIFAYQAGMKKEAMNAFLNGARKGQGEVAYDNALAMAQELEDYAAMEEIATEAFNKYGKQNAIGALINVYIKNKQNDKALDMLNKAIEVNPNSSVLYNYKGVLIEDRTNREDISPEDAAAATAEALELYKKATEVNPEDASALFNYGRVLANKAYTLSDSDEANSMTTTEFNAFKANTLDPLFKQAAEYLEKSIAIDKDSNRQAFTILKNIYYNLGDETNMHRIEELELD